MRKLVAAVALVTAAGAAAPVLAQQGAPFAPHAPAPPSVLSGGISPSHGYGPLHDRASRGLAETYGRMTEFGRCATALAPAVADRALRGSGTDGDTRVAMRRLLEVSRPCRAASGRLALPLLQSSLAEAGYARLVAEGASLQGRPAAAAVTGSRTDAVGRAAACIVARAPAGTQQLLATRPGSAAERQSLELAFDQAGECGQVAEATLPYLPYLRGEIALAAYRALRPS